MGRPHRGQLRITLWLRRNLEVHTNYMASQTPMHSARISAHLVVYPVQLGMDGGAVTVADEEEDCGSKELDPIADCKVEANDSPLLSVMVRTSGTM